MEDTSSIDRFAQRLKILRRERGITQQQLADGVGISKSGLSYYENAGRTPDISILERFADYFGVTTDYLLGRTNAQTQKAKLQAICNHTGLSDKAVNLLSDLKKNFPAKLRVINSLLEQAVNDIEDDYVFDEIYDGSVLNAVCRYLDGTTDRLLSEEFDDYSDDPIRYATIRVAVQKLMLDQAVSAMCHW